MYFGIRSGLVHTTVSSLTLTAGSRWHGRRTSSPTRATIGSWEQISSDAAERKTKEQTRDSSRGDVIIVQVIRAACKTGECVRWRPLWPQSHLTHNMHVWVFYTEITSRKRHQKDDEKWNTDSSELHRWDTSFPAASWTPEDEIKKVLRGQSLSLVTLRTHLSSFTGRYTS